ncbi:MAG: DUF945 family protein [Proteobacteria bacterium]|nr:DUF945 family protein [Pseudomonadota bacterium]
MKKLVAIIVVALVAIAVVGPRFMGGIAHSRLDDGLDQLVEKVPYIKIAERKWTQGWFRSDSTVTFEFVLPGASNKPVAAFAEGEAFPEIAADEPMDESAEAPADEPAARAIPKFPTIAPLRFSVSSKVLHGPVLGGAGLGLARLDTKFVISQDIRNKLIEVLGTDDPVRIRTRMAFFGGGTTTFSGDARTVPLGKLGVAKADGSVSWDDFKLAVGMSRKGKSYGHQRQAAAHRVQEPGRQAACCSAT